MMATCEGKLKLHHRLTLYFYITNIHTNVGVFCSLVSKLKDFTVILLTEG